MRHQMCDSSYTSPDGQQHACGFQDGHDYAHGCRLLWDECALYRCEAIWPESDTKATEKADA